jgi:hypothetical protein
LFKLKPLFDVFNGGLKDNYRFWPGLLLVARLPPLFAVTYLDLLSKERHLTILSILLIVAVFLLMQIIWSKGVYESHFFNILESWFLLKIIIMVIIIFVTMSVISDSTAYKVLFTIFVAFFMCSFIIILGYHVHLKLVKRKWYQRTTENLSFSFAKDKRISFKSKLKPTPISSQRVTHSSVQIERHGSFYDLLGEPSDDSYLLNGADR